MLFSYQNNQTGKKWKTNLKVEKKKPRKMGNTMEKTRGKSSGD
jgi:hypothetical protein